MPSPDVRALIEQARAQIVALVDERFAAMAAAIDQADPQDAPPRRTRRTARRPPHVPQVIPTDLDRARARAVLRSMGLPVPEEKR